MEKPTFNPWQVEKDLARIGDEGVEAIYDNDAGLVTTLRIRSVASPSVKKAVEVVAERTRAKYKNRAAPSEVIDANFNELLASTILVGWDDRMVDRHGAPLPFSHDAALEWVAGNEHFRMFVAGFAGDRKNFVIALEEEAEKNLSTATSGISSGVAVENNSATLPSVSLAL